ncbi:hypothetical protein MBLNU13_g10627t1 [Cladosporium sp. NU13]
MDYVPILRPSRAGAWRSKADFFRPFRSSSSTASETGENITPLYDPTLVNQDQEEEPDLADLNTSLAALVELFPDVQPEVFREMLLSISKESRLQVVTEQLLKKKAMYVNGRLRPSGRGDATVAHSRVSQRRDEDPLPAEDTFRGENYRKAVKQLLYLEFKNLSHSTIRGVMAEHNDSYTLSRPTLQQLSAKSWRFSISALWSKRSPASSDGDHVALHWHADAPGVDPLPSVKRTGSAVLDRELHGLFVEPWLVKRQQERIQADHILANQLNEVEAEEVGAVFDCECCYSSVPFERIATCNDGSHYLCFDCISRTTNEAIYGQGWARSADLERMTLRCFAPALQECQGAITSSLVQRALSEDLWLAFQTRATSDTVTKSQLPLQRCPFCIYGEVDETPAPRLRNARQIACHILQKSSPGVQGIFLVSLVLALFLTIPFLLLASFIYFLSAINQPTANILRQSWTRVHKQRRGLKFRCLNPECSKTSCTRCLTSWRDPHSCFETEKTSLRTAIESSATAAIKRTCPKCHLSFVKSSGCNKLVCNCGYTMCYVCRGEITSKEGYTHFCQHFRPHGGRCNECERCDLYGDEDEADAIRKAAEKAEKLWREKEGLEMGGQDEEATKAMVDALVGKKGKWWEEGMDAVLNAVLA